MNKTIALAFALSTLFFAGCCTTHQAQAWEYKIVTGYLRSGFPLPNAKRPPTLGEQLNQAAAEGWEVVSTGTESNTPFVILRRQK